MVLGVFSHSPDRELLVSPGSRPLHSKVIVPRFHELRDASDLERALGTRRGLIDDVVAAATHDLYRVHMIPKRNRARGFRVVHEVVNHEWSVALRDFNALFAMYLREYYSLPLLCCHGYVKECSILTNASAHCEAPAFVRADIRDFFPSISVGRVVQALRDVDMQLGCAKLVASLVCIDGGLALGLSPNPVIANLVALPLDRAFLELADTAAAAYTRYGDDLTFSGDFHRLPNADTLASILDRNGFQLAVEKYRKKKRGQALTITGLTVFDAKPRVPRRFKHSLRQELYFAEKVGLEEHAGRADYASTQDCVNRIDGRIQFLKGIEPEIGWRLDHRWRVILQRDARRPGWSPRSTREPFDATLLVDESVFPCADGTSAFALAVVVVRDVEWTAEQLAAFAADVRVDGYHAGVGGDQLSAGVLHYQELSEEIRTDLVRVLHRLPLRCFVAYAPHDSRCYCATWLEVFEMLLRPRLKGLDRSRLRIIVEQNSAVPRKAIQAAVSTIYQALDGEDAPRPIEEPSLIVASKTQSPLLALPDALLGVFQQYAALERNAKTASDFRAGKRPSVETRFERLRQKYRLIREVHTGRAFRRARQFGPWPGGHLPYGEPGEGRSGSSRS